MRRFLTTLAFLCLAVPAAAQTPAAGPRRAWSFAAYVDLYASPDESPVVIPTLFADRGRLHLEGRYNYEDLETASLFVGWSFATDGEDDYVKVTPMLGAFFGNSSGVAPGVEVEASWRRFAYWLEAEYAVDPEDSANNFLYTWSELNWYARDWLWVGASAQRLRVVASPREVDFAPMIGFGRSESPVRSLSLYAYGLGTSTPWYLATLSVEF